ncbi:mobile mystery protein A [Riemerella columbina]|nr:mobile mystery protein A [Riemerella columbina]
MNDKIEKFSVLKGVNVPPVGWVKAIRKALGISLQQLGNKRSISKQSVLDIERREQEGTISLNALREIGKAMDMELVYGFVPKDGNLNAYIERKARELAIEIVMRSANTMKLEEQENTRDRILKAIEERTEELIKDQPKILWD